MINELKTHAQQYLDAMLTDREFMMKVLATIGVKYTLTPDGECAFPDELRKLAEAFASM